MNASAARAEELGLTLVPLVIEVPLSEPTTRRVFESAEVRDVDALIVDPSSAIFAYRRLIADLAMEARLPGIALHGI